MNSFFPDGIKAWNNAIALFPNIPSINILNILHSSRKKSIFNIHDPVGIRYLFLLRVGLSPLRSHTNRHGFLDTPLGDCLCNRGIEDTNHFLLLCSLYATERAILITSVTEILIKYNLESLANQSGLYLYGHKTIVFADTHHFIYNKFYKRNTTFYSLTPLSTDFHACFFCGHVSTNQFTVI